MMAIDLDSVERKNSSKTFIISFNAKSVQNILNEEILFQSISKSKIPIQYIRII